MNGRASGPVLTSLFLFVPDHSASAAGAEIDNLLRRSSNGGNDDDDDDDDDRACEVERMMTRSLPFRGSTLSVPLPFFLSFLECRQRSEEELRKTKIE